MHLAATFNRLFKALLPKALGFSALGFMWGFGLTQNFFSKSVISLPDNFPQVLLFLLICAAIPPLFWATFFVVAKTMVDIFSKKTNAIDSILRVMPWVTYSFASLAIGGLFGFSASAYLQEKEYAYRIFLIACMSSFYLFTPCVVAFVGVFINRENIRQRVIEKIASVGLGIFFIYVLFYSLVHHFPPQIVTVSFLSALTSLFLALAPPNFFGSNR